MKFRLARAPRLFPPSVVLLSCLAAANGVSGQVTAALSGRVTDASSGEAVSDATVVLEGTGLGTVSNDVGLFAFEGVPVGEVTVRVLHIAYGDFRQAVLLEAGTTLTLRVLLSPTAIAIEPVLVEARSRRTLEARARGTANNVVTRTEIEGALRTSENLARVLQKTVAGATIRAEQGRPGSMLCLEFRQPRSLSDPFSCKGPTVFLDGVRVSNPRPLWSTFPLEDIERLEVVPAVEAGARYGTDSNYGVVLIETRTGRNVMGRESAEEVVGAGGAYDWTLESRPYPWTRVLGSSFVANALGFAAGAWVAGRCLNFDGLSNAVFNSSCGGAATAGSAAALYGLPLAVGTFATGWAGRTDLSAGKPLATAVGGALALIPGTLLVAAEGSEGFSGSEVIGWALIAVGTPVFSTLADRFFRSVRGDPLRAVENLRR